MASKLAPEAPEGAFCAVFRADAESADERGWRARRRRFSGGSGGRSPPGKPQMINLLYLLCLRGKSK
eukprot:5369315-Alexandrium_andersonii.AAC.1